MWRPGARESGDWPRNERRGCDFVTLMLHATCARMADLLGYMYRGRGHLRSEATYGRSAQAHTQAQRHTQHTHTHATTYRRTDTRHVGRTALCGVHLGAQLDELFFHPALLARELLPPDVPVQLLADILRRQRWMIHVPRSVTRYVAGVCGHVLRGFLMSHDDGRALGHAPYSLRMWS